MNILNRMNCVFTARAIHISCTTTTNSNRTSVCKIKRSAYLRMYPTLLVKPDGSTIRLRYHEPRKIIKLPLDLNALTADQQAECLKKRKPKEKIVVVDDIQLEFDPYAYVKK